MISNNFNVVNTLWHLIMNVILDSEGVLFSYGSNVYGGLGRPDHIVPGTTFGRVAMDDAVLAVAVGYCHVLVMTATKVGWSALYYSGGEYAANYYNYCITVCCNMLISVLLLYFISLNGPLMSKNISTITWRNAKAHTTSKVSEVNILSILLKL